MRPWTGQNLFIQAPSFGQCGVDSIFAASISQLKRTAALYVWKTPESRYSAYWHVCLIYVVHAALDDSNDREWYFYFLVCLQAYGHLSIAYPFARLCYEGLLALAMSKKNLSPGRARSLKLKLERTSVNQVHRDRCYSGLRLDFHRSGHVESYGTADALAGQLEMALRKMP